VPPHAYGKGNKEDTDKDRLIDEYFDELCGRRRPARLEESDDDEDQPASLKKQEGEHSQELGNIPAYVPERETRPTGHGEAAQQHVCSDEGFGKSPKSHKARPPTRSSLRNGATNKKDNEDEDESEPESESELASDLDPDSDSDSKDAEDAKEEGKKRKAILPMVAVRRGLALLKDKSTNATPTAKHRFSTIAEGGRKAVLRGRVANKADEASDREWTWVERKGWTLGKKRACEDESDVEDCIQVASKKAKVEAAS
jgi:hypothetical protein